jgi:hypothetical protein
MPERAIPRNTGFNLVLLWPRPSHEEQIEAVTKSPKVSLQRSGEFTRTSRKRKWLFRLQNGSKTHGRGSRKMAVYAAFESTLPGVKEIGLDVLRGNLLESSLSRKDG